MYDLLAQIYVRRLTQLSPFSEMTNTHVYGIYELMCKFQVDLTYVQSLIYKALANYRCKNYFFPRCVYSPTFSKRLFYCRPMA